MIQKINNLGDVETFMHDLVNEGVNAHPDELFENYINLETGDPTFTQGESAIRNVLMQRSFEICENEGIDIYSLMQEIFLKETGLDKYIPLPSQL